MNDGGATVGIVGDAGEASHGDEASDAFADAASDVGGDVVTGSAADVLAGDPAVVVAVGESALLDVATRRPEAPIVPVDAGRGVRSLRAADLVDAATSVVAGEWTTESHPLLSVSVDEEEQGVAVLDVSLVTAEAAHISEYDLVVGDDRLGAVRADGVVIATPAGSPGYARRLDAPIIAPGSGAVVVPIAPFATDPDHWVVDPDGLSIELERDEAPVELVVDDAVARAVDPNETVSVAVDGSVETVVLPASRSRYD